MSAEPGTSPSSRRRQLFTLAGVGLLVVVCGLVFWFSSPPPPPTSDDPPVEPTGPPWFEDVTFDSQVRSTYSTGAASNLLTILESLGGGVALIDYDGDNRLDLFLPGGGEFTGDPAQPIRGRPCQFYRNLGGCKFRDVTAEVGLAATAWWYTHGAAVADYDRDGWPDLLVTGFGRIALFQNQADGAGGRRFADVSAAVGLSDPSWATSAGWGDVDGDGFPELYVCHYCDWSFANNPPCLGLTPGVPRDVCPPERFKPLVHALFKNDGGKRFRDVSAENGFVAKGNGLGVVWADVNDDGRPDIYVANDATNNFLFMNRGGRLEEKGLPAGVAVDAGGKPNGSMGVDAGDYNGSGRVSLWVTNFQSEVHALYENDGRERFRHVSSSTGPGSLSRSLVGFGTGFLDADNDGWEDLMVTHGHVLMYPPFKASVYQLPLLLRNEPKGEQRHFLDVSKSAGRYFQSPQLGRGLAVGDLDNDGWPDLVANHSDKPVAVLRNVVGETSPARWVGVRLTGKGNRDVTGSTLVLEADGRRLTRFTKGGGSYLSAPDRRVLFGLGSSSGAVRLTVKWAWGESQTWEGLQPGSYWDLREGVAEATRITADAKP